MTIRDTPTEDLERWLEVLTLQLETSSMNNQVRHATRMKIGAIRLTLNERNPS